MMLTELLAEHPDLDCDLDVRDGDIVSDVVILIRSVTLEEADADTLVVSASPGCTYLTQKGMLHAGVDDLTYSNWKDN